MGSVAVTLKVMPESLEVDLEALKARVRSVLQPSFRTLEERPIAFGLKAIVAIAVIDDAGGGSERLEEALAALPGVGSVETIDVSLV
ncbi:MAG TPA: elongation factor 1-beta [Thermoplasmata archaeon]|jgi:elongation factor 1-beta|nr:elongation factor 1-beta [Thermoplasmata archaeon]